MGLKSAIDIFHRWAGFIPSFWANMRNYKLGKMNSLGLTQRSQSGKIGKSEVGGYQNEYQ